MHRAALFGSKDPTPTETFIEAGRQIRRILVESTEQQQLHGYLNYAFGDERLQALYGYEPWRLERLMELKTKYDPCGKFDFYNPIPQARRTHCHGE